MRILLTGATGFVGAALCPRLLAAGHELTVVSRNPEKVASRCGAAVTAVQDFAELPTYPGFDGVINLAGAPIADRRWSRRRKRVLRDSRIALTRSLVDYLRSCDASPQWLVSASAVGYYGDRGDDPLDEDAEAVDDFAHRLCRDWETEARRATELGTRVCILRLGLILGRGGGLLQRMAPPFKLGLGGPLGSGEQWMSWVHRADVVAMIEYLIEHEVLTGVFNATAPNPVTNREFSRQLARQFRRPMLFRVPASLLRLALGEMSLLLLGGQRVLPVRIQKAGFNFRYETLEQALSEACGD